MGAGIGGGAGSGLGHRVPGREHGPGSRAVGWGRRDGEVMGVALSQIGEEGFERWGVVVWVLPRIIEGGLFAPLTALRPPNDGWSEGPSKK